MESEGAETHRVGLKYEAPSVRQVALQAPFVDKANNELKKENNYFRLAVSASLLKNLVGQGFAELRSEMELVIEPVAEVIHSDREAVLKRGRESVAAKVRAESNKKEPVPAECSRCGR